MAEDIFTFQADLAKLASYIDVKVSEVQQLVTLKLHDAFVLSNPVDTGYSRSQWRVATGAPDTTVGPPPARRSRAKNASQPPAIPAPSAQLARPKKGESTFVTNSVDYVRYLNEGSSQQAPSGFIEKDIKRVADEVASNIRQLE